MSIGQNLAVHSGRWASASFFVSHCLNLPQKPSREFHKLQQSLTSDPVIYCSTLAEVISLISSIYSISPVLLQVLSACPWPRWHPSQVYLRSHEPQPWGIQLRQKTSLCSTYAWMEQKHVGHVGRINSICEWVCVRVATTRKHSTPLCLSMCGCPARVSFLHPGFPFFSSCASTPWWSPPIICSPFGSSALFSTIKSDVYNKSQAVELCSSLLLFFSFFFKPDLVSFKQAAVRFRLLWIPN